MSEKQKNKFNSLGQKEALAKQKEMTKELLTARLSLDPATVTAEGGLNGLRRDFKKLRRQMAAQVKNRGTK